MNRAKGGHPGGEGNRGFKLIMLFLASGLTDGKQNKVECTHSKLGFPKLSENTSDEGQKRQRLCR